MDVLLDERTLRRIITLLVALAGLAERAAFRSLPVRWFVLCLLRHAETVALGFVAGQTGGADLPDLGQASGGARGPIDALAFGLRLRLLAATLAALLPPPHHGHGCAARHRRGSPAFPPCRPEPAAGSGGWPAIPPDTS